MDLTLRQKTAPAVLPREMEEDERTGAENIQVELSSFQVETSAGHALSHGPRLFLQRLE